MNFKKSLSLSLSTLLTLNTAFANNMINHKSVDVKETSYSEKIGNGIKSVGNKIISFAKKHPIFSTLCVFVPSATVYTVLNKDNQNSSNTPSPDIESTTSETQTIESSPKEQSKKNSSEEKIYGEKYKEFGGYTEKYIEELAKNIIDILQKEDYNARGQGKQDAALVEIENDNEIMIIGDMHGTKEALDLIPKANDVLEKGGAVVFLGDLIDSHTRLNFDKQDELSIDCLVEAMKLKNSYSEQVAILRGNHECHDKNSNMSPHTFFQSAHPEILEEVLTNLPLACVIKNNSQKYFCIHGAPSQGMSNINSNFGLTKFKWLTSDDVNTINCNAVWRRDFTNSIPDDMQNFCEVNKFKAIFRGHDPKAIPNLTSNNANVYTIHSNKHSYGKKVYHAIISANDKLKIYVKNENGEFDLYN